MGETTLKNCVSEFIGTYLLVLTVGCNVIGGSGTWAALSIASVLMVSIYALGSVSGANFNPAVSFTLYLGGHFDIQKFAIYTCTQLVAGVLAGLSYLWLFGSAFNLAPGKGHTGVSACVAEVLYTFMLCFTVLRAAVSKLNPADNEYFGLAIGFVIVAGGYAAGGISGGAFNPAVAVGIDVASAGQGFFWCLPYAAAELAGALLAVGVDQILDSNVQKPVKQFLSEFLGTYFLVLTVGLNVLGGSPAPALSIAASLMVMIYNLGGVSGAHFNPAVTVMLSFAGKAPLSDAPLYIFAQLIGGGMGALTYTELTGKSVPLQPGSGHAWSHVAFAEIVYTFVLCFVILNVATLSGPRGQMGAGGASKQIYGLAIGFCIIVGGFAIGSVSGGSLNPAVSFALDASNRMTGGHFGNSMAYTCFEMSGAVLAALTFTLVRTDEFSKGAPVKGDECRI